MRRLTFVIVILVLVRCWEMVESQQINQLDATQFLHPSAVKLGGLLGYRFQVNERNRLLPMDEKALLSGFRNRPGVQAWIGEHVGKWLHAAVLTWQNTGNQELKGKIERIVRELIATQEPDGYLGTYDFPTRWTMEKERGWDVWVHKYVLIGLLSYVKGTRDTGQGTSNDDELKRKALDASCKAADLILRTFGTGEGQLDLMERSTHVGMASSSILQPMVWLYRLTGDKRYLDFCRYIVWAWEHSPRGPRLLSSLLSHGDVHRTANAKAYEMMSCLVGALELYRTLRDEGKEEEGKALLLASKRAWDDIAENHLYITGGTSLGEFFQPDHHLPNDGAVSETCATVTLLQFTLELFRLTGEAKYMDIAERTVFNHLLAAQHPKGDSWCYFTPLEGQKGYGRGINCCTSSGPRGIALLPTFLYTIDRDGGIRINLFAASQLNLKELGIGIEQQTDYPYDGTVILKLRLDKPKEFAIRIRVPNWCETAEVKVNDEKPMKVGKGYFELKRSWLNGDTVEIDLPIKLTVVNGTHTNEGKLALTYGSLVLAFDQRFLPAEVQSLKDISIPSDGQIPLKVVQVKNGEAIWEGERAFEIEVVTLTEPKRKLVFPLTDFAHASSKGTQFFVWIPKP
ncbi:MAG: glycoside hydrolase family 127 protein [Armatimonadetes bacterium]|nr:glycoside hydrolase family 127 protein [Armatimonadota bacterium]MDW8027776.1 glycoside hydrolase family 127 protein [Armatimonadota bacterium]